MALLDTLRRRKRPVHTPARPASGALGYREPFFVDLEQSLAARWQEFLDEHSGQEISISKDNEARDLLREEFSQPTPDDLLAADRQDPWLICYEDVLQFSWDFDKLPGGYELDHADFYGGAFGINFPTMLRDLEMDVLRWAANRETWPAVVRPDLKQGYDEYMRFLRAYERPSWRELCQDPKMREVATQVLGNLDPGVWPLVLQKIYERRLGMMAMHLGSAEHNRQVRYEATRPTLEDSAPDTAAPVSDHGPENGPPDL